MKILAIETSCDDTGVTILETKNNLRHGGDVNFKVLADELASQAKIHSAYGGVYPNLAKNEHIRNLPILLEKALKKSKIRKPDLITVTYGPGIEPCLWTGITFAQDLAERWNIPVVPTNHMEGHIISVFGKARGSFKIPKIKFPILSLLVSGGHTELVLSKNFQKHKIVGKTLDDAAGEAFDKVARMLGLPYPGGPEISKLAEQQRRMEKQGLKGLRRATGSSTEQFSNKKIAYPEKLGFSFPRPMLKSKDLNFSFSGLKTSVLYFLQKNKNAKKSAVALELENAIVDTLVFKTQKAVEKYKTKILIVGGGVSANKHLRKELKKIKNIKILLPTPELARDNALMIGMAGFLRYRNGEYAKQPLKIKAQGDLEL